MAYKKHTTYGECPGCGRSCQPDVVGVWREQGDLEEYAVCCGCRIVWSYVYPAEERDKWRNTEPWERVYEPVNIETFEEFGTIPFECQ